MITRDHRQVTFQCDTPCAETETVYRLPRETDEDIWLHKAGWRRQGRFLFCPCCVEARAQLKRAA